MLIAAPSIHKTSVCHIPKGCGRHSQQLTAESPEDTTASAAKPHSSKRDSRLETLNLVKINLYDAACLASSTIS